MDAAARVGFEDLTIEESLGPKDLRAEPLYFGPHRVCFEIGSGGMASVFLARTEGPLGFERLVALKRVHPHLASDSEFVAMFVDEARIASQINHPHVCSVFDFGNAHGTYFIAMQYLVGEPLHRTLEALARRESGKPDPRSTLYLLHLLADACEGLHAAHEARDPSGKTRNVVHRDVSPQNLIVTYSGQMSVVDFGIASAVGRYRQTRTGEIRGKTAYMAPEQFRGMEIDRRLDVWAAGVVLWECVARRRLFVRDTPADTVLAILHDDAPPLTSLRPELPKELDGIVARALARNPADRFPTARDLGRAIEALVSKMGAPSSAEISDWMATLFPGGEARRRAYANLTTDAGEVPAGSSGAARMSMKAGRGSRPPWLVAAFVAGSAVTAAAASWIGARPLAERDAQIPHPVASNPGQATTAVSQEPKPEPPASPPLRTALDPEPEAAATHEVPVAAPPDRVHARAPAASAPAARRPAGTGVVTIVAPTGWATVSKGATVLGQTPLRTRLTAGVHTLEVRFGNSPAVQRVRVRIEDGGNERVIVTP